MTQHIREYVDGPQLAQLTGLSVSYFNKARVTGDGPPFIKIGKAVRYRWADVEAWLHSRTRRSTSEQIAA